MGASEWATFVGTGLALIVLGFGIGGAWQRRLREPPVEHNIKSGPAKALSQINLDFVKPELRRLDIVGYSVHSMYDRIQGLVSHALGSRVPVRILLLNSASPALTEKSALEHPATPLKMVEFRERSQANIKRTAERIHQDAETARYQANLGSVDCQVRVYNTLPVYRAVITNLGTVSSSYLDDLSLPSRDFPMDGPKSNPIADAEAKRADQWFTYLWHFRSRPVENEAVLVDLYDTIVRVDPRARNRLLDNFSKTFGLDRDDFSRSWSRTKAASNSGIYATTEDRFKAVLADLGQESNGAEIARRLSQAEHDFLRSNVEVNPAIPELFRGLRDRGYRVGVVSNCSPSVQSWFTHSGLLGLIDTATFSFEQGATKPASVVYEAAAAGLGVEATACLFVGDGEDDELSGASRCGMKVIRAGWYADNVQFEDPPVARSVRDLAYLIDGDAQWQF